MKIAKHILDITGWKLDISAPDYDKCIVCVAPHTSNIDFFLGKLAWAAVGRKASFMMKSTWFFWPLGPILRAIGGVAVPRGKNKGRSELVDNMVRRFAESRRLCLAITPEGTRSRTSQWHTGFLRIAVRASVPVVLGVLDFEHKNIIVRDTFMPSGETEAEIAADMRRIKQYYAPYKGKYPDKFSTDEC